MHKSFKDLSDLTRRICNRLGAEGYTLAWNFPGYDMTFVNAFISGAKRLVKERITERPRVPLSTAQLFCIVLALIPPNYQRLGAVGDHRRDNFLFIACVLTVIFFLADGLRGGELLTEKQKNHSKKALRKIPRVSNLVIYFKSSSVGIRLSDYSSKRKQLVLLRRIYKELDCYGIFHVFYTKPGRHRRIAIQHHHVLNSQLLCPLCHFATYMFYRICHNDTPLKEGHPMFIFEGVAGKWFPMTSAIFNSTLLKVCMDIGLLKVTKSNFKIGILTELWHSSILNILPFHPDLRFF